MVQCLCGRYYNLDAYYRHQMEKEMKKGFKKVQATERTVFNDEEQRRYIFVHTASTNVILNWFFVGNLLPFKLCYTYCYLIYLLKKQQCCLSSSFSF